MREAVLIWRGRLSSVEPAAGRVCCFTPAAPRIKKTYPRYCGLRDNPITHPTRAAREASCGARVGQPDPLAERARCGQGGRQVRMG
jgi:hypothetical protein